MKLNKEKIILIFLLFLFGILYRLIDYPPNFTPIAAIALFSGFYFRNKYIVLLPLAILLFSDLLIGFYQWQIMLSVYLSIVLIGGVGLFINRNKYIGKILFGSVLGSCLFFLATNFAVWAFGSWYSNDINGLMQCYYMAIPFFRNTIFGDVFFTGLIFSAYEFYSAYAGKSLLVTNKEHAKS